MSILDKVKKVIAKTEEVVAEIETFVVEKETEIVEEVKMVKCTLHEYHENKVKPQNDPQV